MKDNVCIIIPARWGSSRFEGKPLAMIGDKPMIQRVYERCKSSSAENVIVATDDERIFNVVSKFGECVMTPIMENGTLRVCHVANDLKEKFKYFINVQGDEPFVDGAFLDRLISNLKSSREKSIVTVASEFKNDEDLTSPSSVKLIGSPGNLAVCFTRSPFFRRMNNVFKHIGIYGFHSSDLMKISKLMPSDLSLRESLEQIRWMEDGYSIKYVISFGDWVSVDNPSDIKKAEDLLNRQKIIKLQD